jgi:hypothetical protein
MSTALKIPKDKFLARLKEQVALVEQDERDLAKFEEEQKKRNRAYMVKRLKEVIKDPKGLDYMHVDYHGRIQINVNPDPEWKRVEFERKSSLSPWEINEVKNIINLVSMAEGDYVPASLHKNAMRFL